MLSEIRNGNFTSSTIHFLMKNGRGGKPSVQTDSYINEKRMERRLGRSLNADLSSRPTTWGHIVEERLYSLLDPFEYEYCSSKTIIHQTISSWVGTPDFITKEKVCDGKCPYTLKSFCELADIAIANDVEALKKNYPEYYWQLLSNSVLTEKNIAELIVYCPYKEELKFIQEICENHEDSQNKIAWIYFAEYEDLPHLIRGNYYNNMYKLTWEVNKDDINALTEAVLQASERLEE